MNVEATNETNATTGQVDAGAGSSAAPSMDDTIRENYRRLTSEGSTDAANDQTTTEQQQSEARARDAAGRFAKTDQQRAQAAAVEGETVEAGAEQSVETASESAEQQEIPLPKSWKKDVAEDWAKTPASVRAEVQRREEDMLRGISEYRGLASIGRALDKVIQPYADVIRSSGVPAPQAIGTLLETAKTLRTGTDEQKVGTLLQVINDYGISFDALTQAHSQHAAQPVPPVVLQLQQKLQQLEGTISQQAQASEQAALAEVERQVESFLADPKRPHARAVITEMQGLLAQGLASTLDEAYDKACQLNPEVRAKLQAQQAEADRRREAEKVASARRAASANVVRRGVHPAPAQKGTMEDTIRKTYRELVGSG